MSKKVDIKERTLRIQCVVTTVVTKDIEVPESVYNGPEEELEEFIIKAEDKARDAIAKKFGSDAETDSLESDWVCNFEDMVGAGGS